MFFIDAIDLFQVDGIDVKQIRVAFSLSLEALPRVIEVKRGFTDVFPVQNRGEREQRSTVSGALVHTKMRRRKETEKWKWKRSKDVERWREKKSIIISFSLSISNACELMMTTTTMTETKPPPAPLPAPPLLSLEPPPSAAAAQREADEDRPTSSPLLALLASAAALAVANASAPAPWTPPRERRALRRVPRNKEMTPEKLVFSLALAFERSPALAEELRGEVVAFSAAGEEGRQRGARPKTQGGDRERRRCLAAALRSAAYLAAGDAEQALLVREAERREKERKRWEAEPVLSKSSKIRNCCKKKNEKNGTSLRTPAPPRPAPPLLSLPLSAPLPQRSSPLRSRKPDRETPRRSSSGCGACR